MAQYPNGIYTPRETENLPGLVYDPANKRNFFSEDFQNNGQEITAIEKTLGLQVQNGVLTLDERLDYYDLFINNFMKHVSINLTNEQIKNLPLGGIEILSAPSAGKGYYPFFSSVTLKTTAGYADMQTSGAYFYLASSDSTTDILTYIQNQADPSITDITDFFGSSVSKILSFICLQLFHTGDLTTNGAFNDVSSIVDQGLSVFLDNASTVLTGGADGNTMQIDVWYAELDLI